MRIKETPDVSYPGVVESPPLEDVVVLADSAGVALRVQRAFSARVRSVRDDGSGLIASRCVEIPLVGCDGEISGILCRTVRTRGVFNRLNASAMDKIVQAASGILSSIKRKQGSAACSVSRSNLSRD